MRPAGAPGFQVQGTFKDGAQNVIADGKPTKILAGLPQDQGRADLTLMGQQIDSPKSQLSRCRDRTSAKHRSQECHPKGLCLLLSSPNPCQSAATCFFMSAILPTSIERFYRNPVYHTLPEIGREISKVFCTDIPTLRLPEGTPSRL